MNTIKQKKDKVMSIQRRGSICGKHLEEKKLKRN